MPDASENTNQPLPLKQVSGIILAGGKSSRFGRNKALVEIQGLKLIERVLKVLRPLFQEIILITNNPEEYAFLKLPMHTDLVPGLGPLGGIHAGLQYMSTQVGFFTACDMPFLNPDLIRYLTIIREGFQVVAPRLRMDFIEPLHAVYDKSCLPSVEKMIRSHQSQIIRLFSTLRVRYVELDEIHRFDPLLRSFFNINRPAECSDFFNKVKKI